MTAFVSTSTLAIPVTPRDHIIGPATAKVTLLQYGDYECPYCAQAYPVVKELRRVAGDVVRFAFRNFPLVQLHPRAEHAAEAGEAAAAQRKFWRMFDMLFEHSDALDDESLLSYAAALDLDMRRFQRDLMEDRYFDRIRDDMASGIWSGVTGTPTFFINEIQYQGSRDVDSLLLAIQEAASE